MRDPDGGSTKDPATGGGYRWLVAALAVAAGALWASTGNPGIALGPAVAVAAVWAVWRLPIRWPMTVLLGLALLVDNPQARPMEGRWQSPLYPLGEALYANLNVVVGVDALRFSILEILLLSMVAVLATRRILGAGDDGRASLGPGAAWIGRLLVVSIAAVVFLEVWGLLRGGDLRQSLWQLRQLLWLPILAWLCLHTFRRRDDLRLLTGLLIVVGIVRAGVGFAYYLQSRLEGHVPAYVTTHSDSVLWSMIVVTCLLALLERPGRGTGTLCALVLPIIGLALLVNDRRIAFVAIFAIAVTVLILVRQPLKRRLFRLAAAASPVLLLYVAVGWHVEHRVFQPVNTIASVLDEDDTSNESRDVENFNLIFTALDRPMLGSGFGHGYHEHIQTYRIDHIFEQYKFIPHNSVLWLLAVGGWIGFLALWGFVPLTIWLAARSHACARSPTERVAALAGVAAMIAFLIQSWGDMGVHDWTVAIIVAAYVGLVGNLARHVGAWRPRSHAPAEPVAAAGRV